MTPEEVVAFIENCDSESAVSAAKELVASGMDAQDVTVRTAERAIYNIEKKFTLGAVGLAPMMKVVKAANDVREALGTVPDFGKAVVCTVDNHTNGRALMALLLQVAGFDVNEVSKDYVMDDIRRLCMDPDVHVCTASSAFATTEVKLKEINQCLIDAGIRDRIVFNVGGSPVSGFAAEKVGADVYADNAADTVMLIVERIHLLKKEGKI
ncbi:putative cobalamin binding protein [Thermoplasmatales archaeon BRNA1]|nr:putative cobalamin binding protein [Thermoplasmatales archaeon BRNA1]